jgi:hypothetical protein
MAMDTQMLLVQLLLRRTTQGKLDWREAIKSDAFQVAFTDKVVRIREVPPREPDDVPDYLIQLVNSDGRVVDEFNQVMLGNAGNAGIGFWWEKMHDLYDMARRTALGSEKILNEVLSELRGNDDEVPF